MNPGIETDFTIVGKAYFYFIDRFFNRLNNPEKNASSLPMQNYVPHGPGSLCRSGGYSASTKRVSRPVF